MSPTISLRHFPALFQASAFLLGGLHGFINPKSGMLSFGLPLHVAQSQTAQIVMKVDSTRVLTIGIAMFAFYLQNRLDVVDTLLVIIGIVLGPSNGYLAWQNGSTTMGVAHSAAGVFYLVWGFLGLTKG